MKIKTIITLTLIVCFVTLLSGCSTSIGFSFEKPSVGQEISFGKYNGSPLNWQVLDSGDDLLLLCVNTLPSMPFDDEEKPWSQSDLKSWLNTTFLGEFNTREVAAIKVENDGSAVRILSVSEAKTHATRIWWTSQNWWLSDDGIDSQSQAAYFISEYRTVADVGQEKTNPLGVRPVIRIDKTQIHLVMSNTIYADKEDNLFPFIKPNKVKLALKDPGLPTLSIEDIELNGESLTVTFQSSHPLAGEEVVICILFDQNGTEEHLIGWSNYDNGSITLHDIGEHEYQLMLITGIIGNADETAYTGPASVYGETISVLKIDGIEENESFECDGQISFSTTGFEHDYLYYDIPQQSFQTRTTPWIPVSWRVNDAIGGNWTEGPFTGQFTVPDPGDYRLTVTYQSETFEPKTETRLVSFTIRDSGEGDPGENDPREPDVNRYTVSYHPNGGTGTVPMDMNRYYSGEKVTLASGDGLRKPGYTFAGWALSDGTVVTAPFSMGNSDVTLFAVWLGEKIPLPPKTGDEMPTLGFLLTILGVILIPTFYIKRLRANKK